MPHIISKVIMLKLLFNLCVFVARHSAQGIAEGWQNLKDSVAEVRLKWRRHFLFSEKRNINKC